MKRQFLAVIAVVTISSAGLASDKVYAPAEAIALAKSQPTGRSGQFEMTVVSTGKTPNGIFLNSTADYRGDDNLTFRLRPIVARALEKRYGAPIGDYVRGKRVVVRGIVVEKPIANMLYGKPRSLNRYQHEVDVDQVDQFIDVSN